MKWLRYIKAIFSPSETILSSPCNRHAGDEENVSYYVPPTSEDISSHNGTSQHDLIDGVELEKSYSVQDSINDVSDKDMPDYFVMKRNDQVNVVSEMFLEYPFNEKPNKPVDMTPSSNSSIEAFGSAIGNLINEFDSYFSRTSSDDAKQVIEMMQYRLIETAVSIGISSIDQETIFDVLRHVPIPFSIVTNGTPIREVKRSGLVFGDKVLLKAQVVI